MKNKQKIVQIIHVGGGDKEDKRKKRGVTFRIPQGNKKQQVTKQNQEGGGGGEEAAIVMRETSRLAELSRSWREMSQPNLH